MIYYVYLLLHIGWNGVCLVCLGFFKQRSYLGLRHAVLLGEGASHASFGAVCASVERLGKCFGDRFRGHGVVRCLIVDRLSGSKVTSAVTSDLRSGDVGIFH